MSGTQPRGRSSLKLTPNKVPAFTLEDMKAYLQSAPFCMGGPTLSGQPPTIETLEFIGCKELTDRLNLFIGLRDDALVCYVVLHGPFRLTLMSYPPGAIQGIPVSETVEEIYDASTGDLLVWGTGPSSTQPSPGKAIRLAYGPEPLQFGELYIPGGPGLHPIVILIHGGYWRARYKLDLMDGLAEDLARRGIAAWNIEYRRVGDFGGGWPGTFLDVARATDYLRVLASTYALDLKRVVPVGHSAGGHLALWLAARSHIKEDVLQKAMKISESEMKEITHMPLRLAGAISLAGVVDLDMAWRLHLSNDAVVGLLGGKPQTVPERYAVASPAALLPLGIPQVVIHGTEDENVPLEVSQAYVAAARAANDPVTFHELDRVDHFDVIDPHSTVWTITVEALRELFGV